MIAWSSDILFGDGSTRRAVDRLTRLALLPVAFLVAVTTWAYLPVLGNGFVWDDGANLVAARALWDRGWQGLSWAFSQPYFGHYQPLTWASYQIDALLWDATPRGVHGTNLALHLITSALVGALGGWFAGRFAVAASPRELGTQTWLASLLGAAVFALHPIHVETVAWATERRDLLSTLFVVAAVLVHLRTSPGDCAPSAGRGLVALLHALAALARAQMTLPFVLLLLDLWPLRRAKLRRSDGRQWARLVAEKGLSFAVAAASGVTALWAQAAAGALTPLSEHGLLDRVVQAGYGIAFYPAALVYRSHWLPLHERPYPFDPLAAGILAPAVAALLGLAALWTLRRRAQALAVAVASYLLLVLPVLGIAQSGIQLVAERYAYLATIPFVLLIAGVAARFLCSAVGPTAKLGAAGAIVALLAAATVATRTQASVWRSDESVWRHVLAHSRSCLADNNLGQLLAHRGEGGPALFHLVRALELVPVYPRPWRAIAALLEAPSGDDPPPIWVARTLEHAAGVQSGATVTLYASALAWRQAGEPERAAAKLRRLLQREPGNESARLALQRLEEARAVDPQVRPPERAIASGGTSPGPSPRAQ